MSHLIPFILKYDILLKKNNHTGFCIFEKLAKDVYFYVKQRMYCSFWKSLGQPQKKEGGLGPAINFGTI